jgi:hypothetical protein
LSVMAVPSNCRRAPMRAITQRLEYKSVARATGYSLLAEGNGASGSRHRDDQKKAALAACEQYCTVLAACEQYCTVWVV